MSSQNCQNINQLYAAGVKREESETHYGKCEADVVGGDKCEVIEEQYGKTEVVDNNGEKCEVKENTKPSGNKIVSKNKKRNISTDKQFVEEPKQQIKTIPITKKRSRPKAATPKTQTVNRPQNSINNTIEEDSLQRPITTKKYWKLCFAGLVLVACGFIIVDFDIIAVPIIMIVLGEVFFFTSIALMIKQYRKRKKQ